MIVKVEQEYNAETFWANFREQLPEVSDRLGFGSEVEVTKEEWEAIQKIEGFTGGPDYAPVAMTIHQ